MLSGVRLTLMRNLTRVNRVGEQLVDVSTREWCSAALGTIRRRAALRPQSEPVGLVLDPAHAAVFTIEREDPAHSLGLGWGDDECALVRVIAKWHVAAHPHALFLRRGDLVADAFTGDLALELGERQQNVEREPPHRARRIELLGHRDERHSLSIEEFDEPGKISKRSGEPVDLVDDHDVDAAGPDISEQALQRGPLNIATREPAVVISVSAQNPALVLLAADVGLAGLALRRERVEFLLEPFLGGFASVNRATPAARVSPRHCCPLQLHLVPATTRRRRSGSSSTRRRADRTTLCR